MWARRSFVCAIALAAAAQAPFDEKKALDELRARIAGHESEPAEKVFKDVQLFKGRPRAVCDQGGIVQPGS